MSKEEQQKEETEEVPAEVADTGDLGEDKVEIEIEENEIPTAEPLDDEKVDKTKHVDVSGWNPLTDLGRKVKTGEIRDLAGIIGSGVKILEPEVVEVLIPDMESDLLLIGQAKGKFGGGQRRVFKQTQKKTREGNKPSFATYAIIGNNNGFVGVGYGKSKETVPAREKALRNAKISVMSIRRGCGSWQCHCGTPHSIPFEVSGKCGSVELRLIPAPKGTGICTEPEIKKILKMAGITDVWSKSKGQTKTKINMIKACVEAIKNLNKVKVSQTDIEKLGIIKGPMK